MVSSQIRRDASEWKRKGIGPGAGAPASFVFEDIPDSANRMNQFLLEWIVHFSTQTPHHYFDYVSVRIKVHVPDLLYNFPSGNHSTGSPRKVRQDEKFLRGKIQRGAATHRLVATNVDLQIRDRENFLLAFVWAPQ